MIDAPFPWLANLWQRFLELNEQQRLPHAVLISGREGVGKEVLVKQMARELLAKDAKNAHLFDSADGHPDLLWLAPEGKAELIKIDQVRLVSSFLNNTAQQGGYRIVVISPADRLNAASANALLKSLEEPGQNTVIFLISALPQLLLPTIRSRCQQWQVAVDRSLAEQWLLQQGVAADWIASSGVFCQEAPLQALSLRESGEGELQKQFMMALLEPFDPLQLAEQYQQQSLVKMVDWLLLMVSTLIAYRMGVMERQEDFLPQASMATRAHAKSVTEWFQYLDRCYRAKAMLNQQINLNPQLFLESLLIDFVINVT